jgi:hypothetical protein
MSWLSKIFSGSVGDVVDKVGSVVDRFVTTGEDKQRFKLELESLLQKRDREVQETIRTELQSRERVLVAELTQGDSYTKRARPTVVYAGLAFILFNYCIVPFIGAVASNSNMVALDLPTEFWVGWSGIVATWSIGRTVEKRGARNRFTSIVTGAKPVSLLEEETSG